VRRIDGHRGKVLALACSGTTIASGGADKTVRFADAATGRPLHASECAGAVVALALTGPRGVLVTAVQDDEAVRSFDAETGRERATLEGRAPVLALALAPGARAKLLLASGLADGAVRFHGEDALVAREDAHAGGALVVRFSPAGDRLASGGADSTVLVWSVP
jgi:WD40 repeat protein